MRLSRTAARKAKLLLMEATAFPATPEAPPEQTDARPEMVCFRGRRWRWCGTTSSLPLKWAASPR